MAAAALWYALFGAFFVINNARNGFAFAGLLLVAPACAVAASRVRRGERLVAAACLVLALDCASSARPQSPFAAGRFLRRRLGSDGLMIWTGTPPVELQYLWPVDFVAVTTQDESREPTVRGLDARLRRRIDRALARNRPVLLGLAPEPPQQDRPADQRQRERLHADAKAWFQARYSMGLPVRDASGAAYLPVLAPRHPRTPERRAAATRPGGLPAESVARALKRAWLCGGLAARAEDAYLFSDLGDSLLVLGDGRTALTLFNEALRRDAGLPEARVGAAIALWRLGDRERAGLALRRTVAADPADDYARRWLGLLSDPNRAPERPSPGRKLLRSQHCDPERWVGLGRLYFELGRPRQALSSYAYALSAASPGERAWLDFAEELGRRGLKSEARWALERIAESGPPNAATDAIRRLAHSSLAAVPPRAPFADTRELP